MNASHDYQRVYVWEQPVRWFHWINAACIVALGVTGWLIAHPPGLLNGGEAAESYWFGTVRFVHFASSYLFVANFAFRLYWASVGNKYTHWRNFFPVTKAQLQQVWAVLKGGCISFERQTRAHPRAQLGGLLHLYGHRTLDGISSVLRLRALCVNEPLVVPASVYLAGATLRQ